MPCLRKATGWSRSTIFPLVTPAGVDTEADFETLDIDDPQALDSVLDGFPHVIDTRG